MTSQYRSALSGEDIVQFIDRCGEALDALAPFLDDLNALGGSDFDTGANAARSFAAVKRLMQRSGEEVDSASTFLQALTVYARAGSAGHVGILITSIIAALSSATSANEVRPIDMRAFLASLPNALEDAFSTPAAELMEMATAARAVALDTPDPIDAAHMMVGRASMVVQDALIEATSLSLIHISEPTRPAA